MKRRRFLYLTCAGLVAMGGPFANCNIHHPSQPLWLAQPHDLSGICDAATLKSIGQGYLNQHPDEENEERLAELVMDDELGKAHKPAGDDPSTQLWLQEKIKKDFESGRTTVVKGWVLSQTEARQCALYALLSK